MCGRRIVPKRILSEIDGTLYEARDVHTRADQRHLDLGYHGITQMSNIVPSRICPSRSYPAAALLSRMTLLAPPGLCLLRLPSVILACSTLDDGLLSGCLPRLGQVAVLEILLKLGDISAKAVVGDRECLWAWDIGVAIVDGGKEIVVGVGRRKHRDQGGLLLGA